MKRNSTKTKRATRTFPRTQWANIFDAISGEWDLDGNLTLCVTRAHSAGKSRDSSLAEICFYGGKDRTFTFKGDPFENCAVAIERDICLLADAAKKIRRQGEKFRRWLDDTGGTSELPKTFATS